MSTPIEVLNSPPSEVASLPSDEPMVVWSINARQKTFLVEHMPEYRKALSDNSLNDFWMVLYGEWFRTWPSSTENRPYIEEVSP